MTAALDATKTSRTLDHAHPHDEVWATFTTPDGLAGGSAATPTGGSLPAFLDAVVLTPHPDRA